MRSLLLSVALLYVVRTAAAQSGPCHFANGTELPDRPEYNEYQPCTSGGPTTICCGINRSNPAGGNDTKGFTVDECLPNGLCQNRVTKSGVESTSYWVDFCTDSNIASGKCLNVCDQTRLGFGNTPMTPCTGRADSDRWCCGGSKACCQSNVGVINLAQVFGVSPSNTIARSTSTRATSETSSPASRASSSASGSASASGTDAPSSSSSSTPIPTTSQKSGLSGGAIAGIVIGMLVGVALLGAVVFFALRARKYKKRAAAPESHEVSGATTYPPQYGINGYTSHGNEKYTQAQGQDQSSHHAPLAELAQPVSELPGGEGYPNGANGPAASPHTTSTSNHGTNAMPHVS